MNNPDILISIILLVGGLLIAFVLYTATKQKEKEKQFIENHRRIRPGMTKIEVLDILGYQCTQSYLKNGVEKLEWRFRTPGYTGRVAKGAYVHTSGITRRISVKFKDNCVIEVTSLNMD